MTSNYGLANPGNHITTKDTLGNVARLRSRLTTNASPGFTVVITTYS